MTGPGTGRKVWEWVYAELNWFRIHLLAFTFIPIIFSGLFMAANPSASSGGFVTDYLDALFMCFSAMTVTGLNVISVSQTRPAQQAFLLILMILGDISVVALVTITCRQIWIRQKCGHIVRSTLLADMYARHQSSSSYDADQQGDREQGIEDQGQGGQSNGGEPNGNGEESGRSPSVSEPQPNGKLDHHQEGIRRRHQLRKKTGQNSRKTEDPHGQIPHASSGSARHSGRGGFPGAPQLVLGLFGRLFPRGYSELSDLLKKCETEGIHAAHPLHRLGKIVEKPMEDRKDRAEVEEARRARWLPPGVRGVVVGRNSQFFEEELSDEELELIGALEYRATKTLTLLLIGHMLFWVFVPFAITAIYFARNRDWDDRFIANGSTQASNVSRTWFCFFQIVSAYSSCGLSLIDTLMVPFQNCYLLIYVLSFQILAGNEALPLFLRMELWLLTKVVKKGSELDVSLNFLLTHSRRMFLYLFPSYQSWWLFAAQFLLTTLGIIGFIAGEHGLPYYQSLGSGWQRFSDTFFHTLAGRASGLAIVQNSTLAPAVNFLYLMLFFTCNYPLVMSIRSTNVYEERGKALRTIIQVTLLMLLHLALGLHGEHAPGKQNTEKPDGEIFSKYLRQHLLPQIFFDLWPISFAVTLICVIERGKLMDTNNIGWFGLFQVIFEVTSGYGTVGLSFGNPYNTSSLSASFRKLSKLIMIMIMLRGRHRGLPLAIDRASMFPIEYLRFSSNEREKEVEDRIEQAGEEAEEE